MQHKNNIAICLFTLTLILSAVSIVINSCNKIPAAVRAKANAISNAIDPNDTSTIYNMVMISADQQASAISPGTNTVAFGTFRDETTGQLVQIGGVSVNGQAATQLDDHTFEQVYSSQTGGSPLRVATTAGGTDPQPGSDVQVTVTGTSADDTVTQTVYMPQTMMGSQNDLPAGNINVLNDLPLHWTTDPANPSGTIIIKLWYGATLSRIFSTDPALPVSDYTLTYTVADNGSFTVPTAALQAFHNNGLVWLMLARGSGSSSVLPVSNKNVFVYATASVTTPSLNVLCAPNWQNTTTAPRCQISGGVATGNQEQEQRDLSPCSSTANQLRWVVTGSNPTACPICSTANCTGKNHKCINGTCETGRLDIISRVTSGGRCTTRWGYYFSDGSVVFDHSEITNGACQL